MGFRMKECLCCQKAFRAVVRTWRPRRTCGGAACQRKRRRQTQGQWRQDNPDYWNSPEQQAKAGQWRQEHSGYWRTWRKNDADYVERNREQSRARMKRRRMMFAKQSTIRRDPVGYLKELHQGPLFAKQTTVTGCLDGILTCMETSVVFANQSTIDTTVAEPE